MKKKIEFLKEMKPILPNIMPNITFMDNIKAVLFDIYGTMLISAAGDILATEMHAKSVVSAFESVGIKFNKDIESKEAGSIIINEYMEKIFQAHDISRASGVKHPEIDVIEIWQDVISNLCASGLIKISSNLDYEVLSLTFEIKTNPIWPMPNLNNIVDELKDKGIYLGIVSNSQFFTPIILNYFIDNQKFSHSEKVKNFEPDLCIYSYKEKMAKPSAVLFEKAAVVLDKKYDIKPHQVLYVGNDMLNDVYCANKCGFKTVLFAGDVRSLRMRKNNELVKGLKPDIIITDLLQIKEILGIDK